MGNEDDHRRQTLHKLRMGCVQAISELSQTPLGALALTRTSFTRHFDDLESLGLILATTEGKEIKIRKITFQLRNLTKFSFIVQM